MVAAWSYIPWLAWGMSLTMQYKEASKPIETAHTILLVFLLCSVIMLMAIGFIERQPIIQWIKRYINDPINFITCGLIVLMLLLALFIGFRYHQFYTTAIDQVQQEAEQKISSSIKELQKELGNIAQRAQAIADDLKNGRLRKDDIEIRMKRDLKENPYLHGLIIAFGPYQFSTEQTLYAPHYVWFDHAYKKEQLETVTDYTKVSEVEGEETLTSWYQAAIKHPGWLKPAEERLSGKLVARYAVPFYLKNKDKPAGVVIAEFALDSLHMFMQKTMIVQTVYSLIIGKGGTFIYHPSPHLVTDQKTIFEYAQQQTDQSLYDLGTVIIKRNKGRFSYVDPRTSTTTWIHYAPIEGSPWSVMLLFTEEEVTLPLTINRHALMGICTALLFAFLLLAFFISRNVVTFSRYFLLSFAFLSSLILLLGLAGLGYIIHQTVGRQAAPEVIIKNQIMLTAYLEDRQQEAATKYQKIHVIPTGILLNSLTFDDVATISVNGSIWQKYDKKQSIKQELVIPGATKVSIEKMYEESMPTYDIIGWKVSATIPQEVNYSQHPFDYQRMVVPLDHPDQKVKLILTPDFDGYETLSKEKNIGITRNFSLSGFSVEEAYFNYQSIEQPRPMISQVADKERSLHYTLVLRRNSLNAFILYFLPLFIVLFALFAAISFTKITDRITSTAIIPYSGPLFALIILHAVLRGKYNIGDVLYVEYLFFLTYLTILLAIFFTILISWKKHKKDISLISKLIKQFFWPVQLMLWYGVTIFAFY